MTRDDAKNNLEDSELKYNYDTKSRKWYEHILSNRSLLVALVLLLAAVAAPLLIYNFYFFHSFDIPPSDGYSFGTCLSRRESRLACGLGNVTRTECHPQCCYDLRSDFCFQRLPSRFSYIVDQPWNENVVLQPRVATVPFRMQNSLTNIRLSIDEITESHLSLRFYDSSNISYNGSRLESKEYWYSISSPEVNVVVNTTFGTIFTTAHSPFIASENIWEIAFKLTDEFMYGLGELPLKENTTKILYSHKGGLNSIPLIFAKSNGSFHGLLIDTSDPTEISIKGENQIVVRSITNIGVKFHLFTGPEPKEIMLSAMKFVGNNFDLEYWMLGAHICNELPGTTLSNFISDAQRERLPYTSLCGNGPISFNYNQCNETVISDIQNVGETIRRANKFFIPHISPHIYYHEELEEITTTEHMNETLSTDASTPTLFTEANTEAYTEEVEPIPSCMIIPTFKELMYREPEFFKLYQGLIEKETVIYPSYANVSDKFLEALWPYKMTIDGLILENSWPLDQKEKNFTEIESELPYFTKEFRPAFNHTPLWNARLVEEDGKYITAHNTYANNFAKAISRATNNTNIRSSSQLMSMDLAVNRQNITTSWTNLHRELLQAALGGISGHWYWSTPICGDTDNFNIDNHASLCVKWYMAGSFLPMIKIHSKSKPRHPLSFEGTHKSLIIDALNTRNTLLPYFYTTLKKGPLLRPMFYQFPKSEKLHNLTTQYSVGDDLLIVPNLHPTQSHVHIWMPPGTWYEFWSGLKVEGKEGDAVTMTTTEADFLTLIRGGTVMVIQKNIQGTASDTGYSSHFSLIIALDCVANNETNETKCQASGSLYMTNGTSIEFDVLDNKLTITADGDHLGPICHTISEISIFGLNDTENNYDHSKHIHVMIELCDLYDNKFLYYDF